MMDIEGSASQSFLFFFFFFFSGRRDNDRSANQRADSCIATPISEEGLSSCEGSGSVYVLDGAGRVSSGLLASTSNINLFPNKYIEFFA